jgi:hypothetical protein
MIGRKKKNLNFEDEVIREAEVVVRWSKKRIAIAVIVAAAVIGGGVLGVQSFFQGTKEVLGKNTTQDKPQIQIPDQKKIQDVIDTAKQDLSNINPQNIIESQPQIQKIINDLEHITGSSSSAKNLICDTICK